MSVKSIVYFPTPDEAIDKMLELVDVKPGDVLHDLGCGDGRVLIAVAKKGRVKRIGIEVKNGT